MYAEREAPLAGGVLWTSAAESDREFRIFPDGCMDLIWTGHELLIAGPDTGPQVGVLRRGEALTGLRFAPGTGPRVLGLPGHEVRDQRVPLDAVWDIALVRRLTEQFAVSSAPGRLLQELSAGLLAQADPPDPVVAQVLAELRAGGSVAAGAARIGLSERQLHRRCADAFGYGMKTLARVLRMQRAVRLVAASTPLAVVAADTGYADQAHLTREVKALTGVTPAALRTAG
jgi:AraC-like DNA-binding protein